MAISLVGMGTFMMWMFWACVYMAQMNPLQTPVIVKEWITLISTHFQTSLFRAVQSRLVPSECAPSALAFQPGPFHVCGFATAVSRCWSVPRAGSIPCTSNPPCLLAATSCGIGVAHAELSMKNEFPSFPCSRSAGAFAIESDELWNANTRMNLPPGSDQVPWPQFCLPISIVNEILSVTLIFELSQVSDEGKEHGFPVFLCSLWRFGQVDWSLIGLCRSRAWFCSYLLLESVQLTQTSPKFSHLFALPIRVKHFGSDRVWLHFASD